MYDSHIPINVMGGCFGERRLVGKPSGRLEECCRFSTDRVLEGNSKKQRLEAKDQGGHSSSILKEEILPDKRLVCSFPNFFWRWWFSSAAEYHLSQFPYCFYFII